MYQKWWLLSNSNLVRQYYDTPWTNHESSENIDLSHDIIKRQSKAQQSIKLKGSFENRIFQWFSAPQNMNETDEATTQIVSWLLAAV
jgi:hypothetical protein